MVILPDKCSSCGSLREYVAEGRAMYLCGSSYQIVTKKKEKRLRVKRSLKCLGWEVPSASRVQA